MRSRRLEVVGTRKNGRARRRHARGELAPSPPGVSLSQAPVLSFAHYFLRSLSSIWSDPKRGQCLFSLEVRWYLTSSIIWSSIESTRLCAECKNSLQWYCDWRKPGKITVLLTANEYRLWPCAKRPTTAIFATLPVVEAKKLFLRTIRPRKTTHTLRVDQILSCLSRLSDAFSNCLSRTFC